MLNHEQEQFLKMQRSVIAQKSTFSIPEPYQKFDSPTDAGRLKGEALLREGKVACLILAGGQGSRLGTSLPKALVEITPVRKKTLLQLFCEKTAAASVAYKMPLQLAIMTSSLNHKQIADYLLQNGYFGLKEGQVQLFMQDEAPFVNEDGNWIEEASGSFAAGPDGNGHSLKKLMESGIGKRWKEQGVESLIVLPIDNPLADPFDAALCGERALKNQAVTIKAIKRSDPAEKVGVIVLRDEKIAVQEYSELPDHFEAPLAHIGLFCFSLAFIEQIAEVELPWHLARKTYKGHQIWKFERFLFDVLAHAEKTGVLVYPREDVYAPLKNLEGRHSLVTVKLALSAFDKRLVADLTKMPEPDHLFELDPAFYYVTLDRKRMWSGKTLPLLDYYPATDII
jgi:UDP-N-acetylglucosamine/UDP-N-acetylgalactosamine diphosphorylase